MKLSTLVAAFTGTIGVAIGISTGVTQNYDGYTVSTVGEPRNGPARYTNGKLNTTERAWLDGGAQFNASWTMPADTKYIVIDDNYNGTVTLTELSPRGGQHYATIYWDFNCPGAEAVATVWNFGCGGACVYKNRGFDSIGLGQDTTSSPWPTANIYADDRCTQYEAHAGIWADRTWGCTNQAAGQTWNSFYLYDGC
jgi:hypothetical protein